MEKIKRFVECLVPVTACNFKCDYCYIIQEDRRKDKLPEFKYSPETIGKALSKERLGGTSYISICGAGETLLPKEMPNIIYEILKQGHFVNVTNNGTMNQRFDQIIEKVPKEMLARLHFAFSLHYLELKRTNNIENFIRNVNLMKKNGCSIVVQLNLYDGYVPYLDEIKDFCEKNFGALPQIAATRKEVDNNKILDKIEFFTNKTDDEYVRLGRQFNSPLFEYTVKNFMVNRKEFCYAGEWSFILNLATGMAKACYAERENQNIFENIEKPIKFQAIGCNCCSKFCVNSSHFMSLGIIPELYTKSYEELRNRKEANWYNNETEQFLNTKLFESNKCYNDFEKKIKNMEYKVKKIYKRGLRYIIKNVNKTLKND